MRLKAPVITALVFLASTVYAAAGKPDEPITSESIDSAKPAENERVCKTERVVGSNIPKRTCTTRRDLRKLQEDSQRWLRDSQGTNTRMEPGEGG